MHQRVLVQVRKSTEEVIASKCHGQDAQDWCFEEVLKAARQDVEKNLHDVLSVCPADPFLLDCKIEGCFSNAQRKAASAQQLSSFHLSMDPQSQGLSSLTDISQGEDEMKRVSAT